MDKWNTKLSNLIVKVLEEFKHISETGIEALYGIIKNNNSILLFLLLMLILSYFYFHVKNSKEPPFNKSIMMNVLSHVALSCIFGYLMKVANVTKIDLLLTTYWSIGFFLYAFFLIVFIKELFLYFKSKKKMTKNFLRVYYILGISYIFAAIATNQLVVINDLFLIVLFIAGWMFLQGISQEVKNGTEDMVDEESDVEIKSYAQLLDTRKSEYCKILELLQKNNYDEPFALLLNGDWGEGKTSLINVLSKRLEREGNHRIFIQPMILDTTEKLMEYFFGQLEDILSSHGIYTGKDSPFKRYLNFLFHSVNTVNLKQVIKLDSLMEHLDSDEKDDFRTSKERLEEDIRRLLNSGKQKNPTSNDSKESNNEECKNEGRYLNHTKIKKKIFIIIDDFDRVEEDTFKNTLIFIKEIVNFKGINVIFLMDDQRIEKHEVINRDYLDKFVNKKFPLSKVGYQEILEHFKSNIVGKHLTTDWTIQIGNTIMENMIDYIDRLKTEFEENCKQIQKKIDELTSNNQTKIGQIENEEKLSHQQEKLKTEKDEFEKKQWNLIKGLSNVRKTKKIIREIKETLIALNQGHLDSENFKLNVIKIDRLEELIVRIAIFKILFEEHVDEMKKSNDFISNKSDIKYSNYVLKSFFNSLIKSGITEEQGLRMDILNDFCNWLILNRSFNRLLEDKQTISENILRKLDDQTVQLDINNLEEIKEYLKVIMYHTYGVGSNIVQARRTKLINHIVDLYRNGSLSLKNLFELLGEAQRNPLLDNELYLAKLKEIVDMDAKFENKQEKTVCLTFLDGISMPVFLNYRSDIIMVMSILKLKNPSFTYESISSDVGDIYSLEEMVKSIKRIFKEEDNSKSEIDFFKQWLEQSIQSIIHENEENKYILEAVVQYQTRIIDLIKMYHLTEELTIILKGISLDPISKFNETLTITSPEELILEINEYYQYIVINNNSITTILLRNINELITSLERYTRSMEIDENIMNHIKALYANIPISEYDNNSDEKRTWLWCTVKMGEIRENIIQLQSNRETGNEKTEEKED